MCRHFGTALDDSVIKVVSAAVGLSFVGNCQVWIQEPAFSRQLAKQVIAEHLDATLPSCLVYVYRINTRNRLHHAIYI
jgi:maleate cis-trans isomerase